MNKNEFLSELERALSGLHREDVKKSLDFYAEMIDDRAEDGLSEEDAVAALGSIDEIKAQIIADTPIARIVKERIKPKRALRVWEIILIVLGSPIWLSLALAAIAVIFSLYVTLWSVVISFFAVNLALGAAFIVSIPAAIFFFIQGKAVSALFMLGCGALCGGLCILWFFVSIPAARLAVWIAEKTLIGIKAAFAAKGDK